MGRVLLVEDDTRLVARIRKGLAEADFDVSVAGSCAEARTHFMDADLDLVVC